MESHIFIKVGSWQSIALLAEADCRGRVLRTLSSVEVTGAAVVAESLRQGEGKGPNMAFPLPHGRARESTRSSDLIKLLLKWRVLHLGMT